MNIAQIEQDLINFLTTTTGVTEWDSIQFSLLPTDEALGYIQLVEMPVGANQATTQLKFMIMIGYAAESLDELKTNIYLACENIFNAVSKPTVCFGSGQLSIASPGIVVDIPDSDITQNNITNAGLMRTALAFTLLVHARRS